MVTDSTTGLPLAHVVAQIPKPRYYHDLQLAQQGKLVVPHWKGPDDVYWYGLTNSGGYTRLSGFKPGDHKLQVSAFGYRFVERTVHAIDGQVDTFRVALAYVGRQPDGRSGEIRFLFDSVEVKKVGHKPKP